MTDIVERLRKVTFEAPHMSGPIDDLCEEAADEIERLRKALTLISEERSFPFMVSIAKKALGQLSAEPDPRSR